MPYQFQPVFLASPDTFQIANATDLGVGSPYNGFVFSAWFQVGAVGTSAAFTFQSNSGGLDVNISQTRVALSFVDHTGTLVFEGISAFATTAGEWVNLLVSVYTPTKKVQAYINDTACPAFAGFWLSTNQIGVGTNWIVQGSDCVGDVWWQPQSAFVDLTTTSNRRKFIAADLTPVSVGANGSTPFGTQPPVFLHVAPSTGVPADFATNLGTGGSFTPNTLSFGACSVYPATIPVADTVNLSEFFFTNTAGFVDFSQASNRRKFIDASGGAVYLGASGSVPFGTQPPVFLTLSEGQSAPQWASNVGSGGAFASAGNPLVIDVSAPPCSTRSVPVVVADNQPIGSDPQIRLSVSDDGGRTWNLVTKNRSMGKTGEYLKRIRWLKLGQFRQRVIKLEITDPVKRNFVGFYADVEEGMK